MTLKWHHITYYFVVISYFFYRFFNFIKNFIISSYPFTSSCRDFFFFFVKSLTSFSSSSKFKFLFVSSANKERISSFLCKISSNRLFIVFSFLNILKMGTKKHLLRCLTNKFMLYYFRYSTPIW